ncbi:MAG: CHAP domain-containing protein [Candidatus Manganitrophus sp.]|nr:MAG: CHAP domain-containing protein [Candidatus Manganitrophus sp.]
MMKRSILTFSTLIILTAGMASTGGSMEVAPCGTTLATHAGVPARSNIMTPDESCGGRATYGLQYQCVEYVRRFYHLVKGMETREGMMGKRWNGNANTYFKTADKKGLDAFENGGRVAPRPDDILAFQGGPYGHVAIITRVAEDHIEFVEQNFSPTGRGRLAYNPVTNRVENRKAGGELFVVEGWLRSQSDRNLVPQAPIEAVSDR